MMTVELTPAVGERGEGGDVFTLQATEEVIDFMSSRLGATCFGRSYKI